MQTAAHTRRIMIEQARKRQRPGSSSTLAFLRERTCRIPWPDLGPTLGDILWAVVGAAATRLYMPERATFDLDVAVLVTNAADARARLAAAGAVYQGERSSGGSHWALADGTPVDVLELMDGWAGEALVAAASNRDAQGLPVLPLPYLIRMKFEAGRLQDIADVTRMLGLAGEAQLAEIREVFGDLPDEDRADLESLIQLGRLETGG